MVIYFGKSSSSAQRIRRRRRLCSRDTLNKCQILLMLSPPPLSPLSGPFTIHIAIILQSDPIRPPLDGAIVCEVLTLKAIHTYMLLYAYWTGDFYKLQWLRNSPLVFDLFQSHIGLLL